MGEQPTLGTFSSPGCDEPTSRCQTSPSIWALGEISLLSPEYLLSFEGDVPSMRKHRITLAVFRPWSTRQSLQSSTLLLICSAYRYQRHWGYLCKPPVTLGEATTPVKLPATHSPLSRDWDLNIKGWYFNADSITTSVTTSQSPTYPTHLIFKPNVKL